MTDVLMRRKQLERSSVTMTEARIPLKFTLREMSGGLGDLGTFLPLAIALSLTEGIDFGMVLLFAGLANIAAGLVFRVPIPVQPMKMIVAVAIAEKLTFGQVSAAGILMGVFLFVFALTGMIDQMNRIIPKALVRGIQAGIGIKLAWQGVIWLTEIDPIGWDSWIVAVVVGAVILVAMIFRTRVPTLLFVFVFGFLVLWLSNPAVYKDVSFSIPQFDLRLPQNIDDWWIGLTEGALPQLPLTILNSVIAVCALSGDYFPRSSLPPKNVAISVSLMNLICVPFGGMPMCHGAGGLAAQYHFGARTGGSMVMLGILKVIAGIIFGAALIGVLQAYPLSILGVMIIAAGVTLAVAAKDSLRGQALIVVLTTTLGIVLLSTLYGFLAGCVVVLIFAALDKLRSAPDQT